tara:strand:- start:33 stop:164 length:132 start_codon:yes stop_codon:yes gene_type:complete
MAIAKHASDDVLTAEVQLANPRLRAFREQQTPTQPDSFPSGEV